MPPRLVALGRVVKPHGLRGELTVDSWAESPDVYAGLARVWLSGERAPREVEFHRVHKGRVLLKVRGIDGRDQAEERRGAEVLADLAELPEKPDEDIYLFELEGLRVLLPDDTPLGVVERVEDDPTEVWTIRTGEGAEVLFPAAEEFILEASPEEGFVRIDPPEGLLEIYLGGE